jgi:class 3 adenylate cyclase
MLKAGIHTGPCIAVTLNECLDYVGSTVNLTARIQRFSEGGDVVISDAVRRDPEVSEFFENQALCVFKSFAAPLKGLDNDYFELRRVKPVSSVLN